MATSSLSGVRPSTSVAVTASDEEEAAHAEEVCSICEKTYRDGEAWRNVVRDGVLRPLCVVCASLEVVGNLWCSVDQNSALDGIVESSLEELLSVLAQRYDDELAALRGAEAARREANDPEEAHPEQARPSRVRSRSQRPRRR